jgi:hypothetical protein
MPKNLELVPPKGYYPPTARKPRPAVVVEKKAEAAPWKPNTPHKGSINATGPAGGGGGPTRMEEKRQREEAAAMAAAAEAAEAAGGSTEARAAAMASAQKALQKVKESNSGPSLREAPSLVRLAIEGARHTHNAQLHKDITFQHRVNERRVRLEAGCGSKAEAERMASVHAADREESRREVLRGSIRMEMAMLEQLKKSGVKSFAGLADAWG